MQTRQDQKAVLGMCALQRQCHVWKILGLHCNPNLGLNPNSAARWCVTLGKRPQQSSPVKWGFADSALFRELENSSEQRPGCSIFTKP